MPDSSCSPQVAVCSEIMSNKQSQSKNDNNQGAGNVQIDLGEVTQHNIKVLKKVNQVGKSVTNYRSALGQKNRRFNKAIIPRAII